MSIVVFQVHIDKHEKNVMRMSFRKKNQFLNDRINSVNRKKEKKKPLKNVLNFLCTYVQLYLLPYPYKVRVYIDKIDFYFSFFLF